MLNVLFIILGGAAIIFALKFGIDELKKLSPFLKIRHEPNTPKHSKKIMMISLVKYLLALFIIVLLTAMITFIMIPVWPITVFITWHYIKLWQYHGYSVLLFIAALFSVIALAVLASPSAQGLLSMIFQHFGIIL